MNTLLIKIARNNIKTIKSTFFKRVIGSFGLKVANTGLGFIRSLMLARWLGVEGLGVYTFALTWIGLLGIVTKLGIPGLLQREIAIYRSQSDWGLIKGILNWSHKFVLLVSLFLIPVAVATAWTIGRHNNSQMILALCLGLLSLPIESMIAIKLSAVVGMQKVVLGQIPNLLIAPLLMVVLTGCSYLILADNLNVFIVLGLYLLANIVTLAIATIIECKATFSKINSVVAKYQTSVWLKSSIALMFLGCMGMINAHTDVLMLGTLKGTTDVGIYVVVNRIASLIIFIVMAANSVIAPSISSFYAEGNIEQLQKIVTTSSRMLMIISILVASMIVFFNQKILLFFGSSFIIGKNSLIFLIGGQLFNVAVGQVNLLLTMTGHARYTAISVGIGAGLNIILNFCLIPQWGVLGAAIATSSSTVVWNAISLVYVKQKLKIDSTCLGLNYQ